MAVVTPPDPAPASGADDTLGPDPGELGELVEVPADLSPGVMVGEYRIERRLGMGGMGVVYGAIHPIIGKRVAIKVLHHQFTHQRATVDRFLLEARSVNRIGHANIVDIFAFGVLPDQRHYFVMEWLDGETLADRIDRARLSRADACMVLDEICDGLAAAHAKGIVHRDLKPDNVYLVAGERLRVKLLDFGIAKLLGTQRKSKTVTGNFVGTPHYVAPEQARGQAVDGRADIYSLGALAFELFAGHPPFEADSVMDVVSMHLHEVPPDLSSLVPVPAELNAIVMSMLEKSPDERPSLAAIREVLELAYLREVAPEAAILDTASGQVVRLSGTLSAARITGQVPAVAGRNPRGSDPPPLAADVGAPTTAPPATGEPEAAPPVAGSATAAVIAPDLRLPPRRYGRWIAAAAIGVIAVIAIAVGRGGGRPRAAPPPAIEPAAAAPPPVAIAQTPPPPPAPATAPIEIVIDRRLRAARATLDGEAREFDRDGRVVFEVAAGTHVVTVTAAGRAEYRRTLEVVAGRPQHLAIELPRVTADRGGRSSRPHRPVDDDGVVDPFAEP